MKNLIRYRYHREGSRQHERDAMKNHILELYGLPLLCFATNGSGEKERLVEALRHLMPDKLAAHESVQDSCC